MKKTLTLDNLQYWRAPDHWQRIHCIDAHTCGEPLRIYVNGFDMPPGDTMLARRASCKAQLDHLRTATMWEPRGHADMYGCLITPAEREDSDFGVLFTHNEGYSSMCGHGIIAVTTVALQTGIVRPHAEHTRIRIDTPAGLVTAWGHCDVDRVTHVRFRNVTSFVTALDQRIDVPGVGPVQFDIVFGGAFYAIVDARQLALSTHVNNASELIRLGKQITQTVVSQCKIEHPLDDELSFLYGTIFTDCPTQDGSDERNVCIFADGELDRSPTGTGVSARLALAFERGLLPLGGSLTFESIIGTQLSGAVVASVKCGPYNGIVSEVTGSAYITGRHELLIDPDDPLKHGFLIR